MSESREHVSPTTESVMRLLLIAADEKQKLQQEIEKLKTDLAGAHKYTDLLFDDKEKLQQETKKLKDGIEKLQTENERLLAGRPRDEKRKRSSSPVVKEEGNKVAKVSKSMYADAERSSRSPHRCMFGETVSEDVVYPWEAEVLAEKKILFGKRVERRGRSW